MITKIQTIFKALTTILLTTIKEYGLREPELIDRGSDFRVNLYRKTATVDQNGVIDPKVNETKVDTNETIALGLIQANPAVTQKEFKEKMQVSLATIKRLMAELQRDGKIQRKGSSGNETWLIADRKQ